MTRGDLYVAWVLWSTKTLVGLSEVGQLAGGILQHQARRLEHAAGRRLARFIDAENERVAREQINGR